MKVSSSFCRTAAGAIAVAAIAVLAGAGCDGCRNKRGHDTVGSSSVEGAQLPPTSNPAAAGIEYEYIDQIWETEEERQLAELLSRSHTAEKAYRMVKSDPAVFLPTLYRGIRSANSEVRIQSVIIIGLMRDANTAEVGEHLLDALILDSKPDVRAVAAKALALLKVPGAVPELIKALDLDPFAGTRADAASALGELKDPAAIKVLRKALSDDDAFVRLRAVGALMDLKSKISIPDLIDRLEDENVMVRERAHQALREITGTDKGRNPDEWRLIYGRSESECRPDVSGGTDSGDVDDDQANAASGTADNRAGQAGYPRD